MARKGYGQPMDVGSENTSVSVSARKIDNGYIVTRSRSDSRGYSCKEEYSATAPDLGVEPEESRESPDRGSSLKAAIAAIPKG